MVSVILVDPGMSNTSSSEGGSLVLKDPNVYHDRASLWNARTWERPEDVEAIPHKSRAYHDGCPTLAPLSFSQSSSGARDQIKSFQERRNLVSPLDELVFHWTRLAPKDLIAETSKKSSNAAYYLLKHVAQHWMNQLELINCTVAKGEYFSDDYQAKIDDTLSGQEWKAELTSINEITKDINYMRRQMNHLWRAMMLNLERLGVQLGCEQVDNNLSLALRGAQMDFLAIYTRLQPLRERVELLTAVANDVANLRAAFKGIYDGEFSLRLAIFASIVFPLILVASILSMGEDFLPGKSKFWIFWASSVPFVVAFAVGLVYGGRLDREAVRDVKGVMQNGSKRRMGKQGKQEDVEKSWKQLLMRRYLGGSSPC
ncbi:hypothetical protein B0T25DRAFT_221753 [Lasiosphaeria hispida]|uniref:Uncharacterized protein n=1 Tax=Lasiosphaeria hispida TaxID=260671 RepID=A0AAJ0HK37_9PEZI|nr:hypothetical protein B0T25DRAFT_221753 [Lasiosphaeria hispida]